MKKEIHIKNFKDASFGYGIQILNYILNVVKFFIIFKRLYLKMTLPRIS